MDFFYKLSKKCGTGALKTFLSFHPDLKTPGELYYFNTHYNNGIEWYKDQMPVVEKSQVAFEKTPSYYRHPDVPGK
jgi:hypothetical protein